MAFIDHSTIATLGYAAGFRTTSDAVLEVHNVPLTWYKTAGPTVLGTCTAVLKKMANFWRLEVPAFQLTGITVGGANAVYAVYNDNTSLIFGTAATTWSAYSNLVETGNVSAAAAQGFFWLDHASPAAGAGNVRVCPFLTVNNTTKAVTEYSQFGFGPGDLHVYTEMLFEIQPVAV